MNLRIASVLIEKCLKLKTGSIFICIKFKHIFDFADELMAEIAAFEDMSMIRAISFI